MAKMKDVCGAVEAGQSVDVPDSFVDTLQEAIQSAREKRELRLFQYWRLQSASRRRKTLERIYAGVIDEGIAAGEIGEAADADGFDWESLLSFIERLLPVILQIIALF